MGVPVVSLVGREHRSRVGASLLHAIGYGAWAVGSADEYLAACRTLASAHEERQQLRQTLRATLRQSALLDCRAYAAAVFRAIQTLNAGA